ncbi:MAG: DUF3784 domain-containing protein [Lachnospiraceae bacterium]|nr:DUF3784 domain-containing protein [Lachnospiraceae bacterium]
MTGSAFDWIMAVICIVCAALLLSGHGDGLMRMFGSASSQNSMKVEKKRTREEELRYQRIIGAYCAVLAVCEIVLALYGSVSRMVPIISMAIAVLGLIAVVLLIRMKS